MSSSMIALALRHHWQRLRVFRFSGSVLADYRILKTHAAKLMKEKVKC